MFEKIEDVPAVLSEFYTTETRQVQQFHEDGSEMLAEESYHYTDEQGNIKVSRRLKPVYDTVNAVVPVFKGECKSWDDVWRVVEKHKGFRDELVRKFVAMACTGQQWAFHDEYLKWYQEKLRLEAIELPALLEGEPDPALVHQAQLDAHTAQEPMKPAKVDIPRWFKVNARQLRRHGYAESHVQAEMLFNDTVNNTTTLLDHQLGVKAQYPKE